VKMLRIAGSKKTLGCLGVAD